MKKILFLLTMLNLYILLLPAQEVIFIPSGDIEGVKISSFYLAIDPITNQDYFTFIQADGYRKKIWWDEESYSKREAFRNDNGEYSPRSWEASNPPEGEEFSPLTGITVSEAQAYAKFISWIVPNRKMWQLAQKVRPEIGDYPWQEGDIENSNGIRLIQYYAPASVWETKFSEMKSTLDSLEKNSAKISTVNSNSSKIRELERWRKLVETAQKQEQDTKKQIQNIESKIDSFKALVEQTEESIKKSEDKTTENFQAQLTQLETKLVEQWEAKWQEKFQALQEKEKALNERLLALETLPQQLQQLTADLAAYKEEQILATTKQKEDNDKNFQDFSLKVESLDKKIDSNVIEIKQDSLSLRSNIEKQTTDLTSLATQTKQLEEITQKNLKEQSEELAKQQTETAQSLATLTTKIDSQVQITEKIDNSIKQLDKKHTDLGNLRDEQLQKQTKETENKVATLQKKVDKSNEDIAGLKEVTRRLDEKNTELSRHQEEAISNLRTQSDAELIGIKQQIDKQSKDLDQLNISSQQMEAKARDFDSRFQTLRTTENQFKKTHEQFDQEILQLKGRATQLEHSDEQANKQLKNFESSIAEQKKDIVNQKFSLEKLQQEKDALDKSLKTTQEDLVQVNIKANDSQNALAKLNKDFAEQTQLQNNSLEETKKRINDLEITHKDIIAQIQANSGQMRKGMMEIGDRLRDLFQNEALFGVLASNGEEIQDKPSQPKIEDIPIDGIILEIKTKVLANIQEALPVEALVAEIKARVLASVLADIPKEKISSDLRESVLANLDSITQTIEQKVWKNVTASMADKVSEIGDLAMKNSASAVKENATNILAQLCYSLAKTYEAYEKPELALECLKLSLQYNKDYKPAQELLNKKWNNFHCPRNMVAIESATATLGSIDNPEFAEKTVTIPSFYIDMYEVSQKDFAQFVLSHAYQDDANWSEAGNQWRKAQKDTTKPENWTQPTIAEENLPITNITFYEAEAYAHWCGKRLPTSEEWEYASRGTDKRIYPWGNELAPERNVYYANYRQLPNDKDGFHALAPVDAFLKDRSPFGVIGMAGNIAEWCSDTYAIAGSDREFKTVSGGSFQDLWYEIYTFIKRPILPTTKKAFIGFRCVKDMPVQK